MTISARPPSGNSKPRLLQRAQVIARLRHPNLVRMLPLPGGAGLVPVVTELRRLSDFTLPVGTFKRFDLEQVVRLMLDVLSGLSLLHEAAIDGERFVHGEVCPQHVYVSEHGTAKLVPITSSHLLNGDGAEPNGYMAPELLLGDRVDARADVFSVGVMLWEALAGKRLFPDGSVDAVVASVVGRQLPRLSLPRRLAWAEPLCAVVQRALAPEPAARFATATELSNAIANAVGAHLASVGPESWQDEAPTPVFQARLHLPSPRSPTPPATVVDVRPDVSSSNPPVAKPVTQASVAPARFAIESLADDALTEIVPQPRRRNRALLWTLLSAAALCVLAVGVAQRGRSYASPPAAQTLPVRPAVAAAAPLPVESAAPASALRANTPESAPAPPLAAPESSALAAPLPSEKPAAKKRPRAVPQTKARRAPSPKVKGEMDYGI